MTWPKTLLDRACFAPLCPGLAALGGVDLGEADLNLLALYQDGERLAVGDPDDVSGHGVRGDGGHRRQEHGRSEQRGEAGRDGVQAPGHTLSE